MNQAPVSLQNLSQAEKDKIAILAKQNLVKGSITYLIPFVIFGFAVWYVNQHYMYLGIEDPNLRSWLNVSLVFLTLLPARLFVNVILRHKKATSAWQKKVIHGNVSAIDGRIITLVNQKIKLSAEQVAKLKLDNEIIVSSLPNGDYILDVEIVK